MGHKRMLTGAIVVFSLLIFFILFLKHFEKRGIYFPTRNIESTPAEVGLEFEDVYFFCSDGLKLNGWYIPSSEPRATVLFCHGNAGNISHRIEIIEMFSRLGLDIFIYDYRGYGKSQGSPNEEGLYSDAQAAYKYLLDKRNLDEKSIVIYGKSLGGNIAIELCSRVSPAALITDSAFTSAMDMGKKLFPFIPIRWFISVKYDALSRIKEITIPKLIIHSEDDEIIPFQHGKRLYEAAPEPKEFYPMRGGHNDAVYLFREDFVKRIDAFLHNYGVRLE